METPQPQHQMFIEIIVKYKKRSFGDYIKQITKNILFCFINTKLHAKNQNRGSTNTYISLAESIPVAELLQATPLCLFVSLMAI